MKKQIIIKYFLSILFILLILPFSKAFAIDSLENISFTQPEDNKFGTSGPLNFSFTFTVPKTTNGVAQPSTNLFFQPYCDNEPLGVNKLDALNRPTISNKYSPTYIYDQSNIRSLGQYPQTKNWVWSSGWCFSYTRILRWTLSEVDINGKILKTYVDSNVIYKYKEGNSGYYYISIDKDGNYKESNKFANTTLCINDSKAFLLKNSTSKIYKECELYDDIPNLPRNATDITLINGINSTENKSVYKMLAPFGSLKCMSWGNTPVDGCITNNIGEYLNVIFKLAIGLCAALAVIMLIIYGVMYMGDESIFGKTEAKHKMTFAVFGLIIALASWALLNTINPALTGVGGINISTAEIKISAEDTSTGSSTSLCISSTPPDPNSALGSKINLSSEMINEYIKERDKISNLSTGVKYLITAQTAVEGFYKGTKSYRTNNPGNIGNKDDGSTKTYPTLGEGIKAQQNIITNIATNNAKSYVNGGKSKCALGDETYNGYLYQYLRIYSTGARNSNAYLNAIIGYFRDNGKTITAKTTIAEIYNMK